MGKTTSSSKLADNFSYSWHDIIILSWFYTSAAICLWMCCLLRCDDLFHHFCQDQVEVAKLLCTRKLRNNFCTLMIPISMIIVWRSTSKKIQIVIATGSQTNIPSALSLCMILCEFKRQHLLVFFLRIIHAIMIFFIIIIIQACSLGHKSTCINALMHSWRRAYSVVF